MRLAGKNNRMWKIIVPLIMGFKTTGALIFGISAVKLFLLQALMVSKVALMAAGFVVVKKLLSSMGIQQHPFPLEHQPHHSYDHGVAGGFPTGYAYSNYVTAGGHYGAATGHSLGASASGADDLHAQFSSNIVTNAQASTANRTATRKYGNNCLNI